MLILPLFFVIFLSTPATTAAHALEVDHDAPSLDLQRFQNPAPTDSQGIFVLLG